VSLTAGTRLGAYDVVGPLGAGGMGEVYRATDSRLKRQVALKILPEAVAADPERLARFQREAEVLASLNHPHIAALYGIEEAAGTQALVMELVEGATLAERIAEGPLPVDEALVLARQIAAALEAAHERGIVHRDLKPANIKIRDDGTVKVLDFGLAKLTERGAAGRVDSGDPSQSPTLTSPAMTEIGIILGTAAYMSPEQARGRAVDKRTDVWAFGAVLYEMLTGVRAFDGEDVTEMMASVVKSTPDWSALPASAPAHVVTLIQRCLEKDRNARIGDIAVARYLLTEAGEPRANAATATTTRRTGPSWAIAVPLTLGGLVAGLAIGWAVSRGQAVAEPVAHLQMGVAPADQLVGSIASVRPARTALSLTPDGRTVVFAGAKGRATQLYARPLDRPAATPIPGTEGATGPFLSPDGASVGFWSGTTLKKVALAGGLAATIADLPSSRNWGGSWGDDGTILFTGREGIWAIPSMGGTPTSVTTADVATGERHILPRALPGGRAILYTSVNTAGWNTANIVLLAAGSREPRVLAQGGVDARYVGTGHILYMKSGTLMAVPFDLESLQVTGTAVPMVENVMQAMNQPNGSDETGMGQFAVSSSGTLLYLTGGLSPNLESAWWWIDRTRPAQAAAAGPVGAYLFSRLSPDGTRVAANVRRPSSRIADIWVYDLTRGAPTRLTFDGANSWPVWSPDGKRLAYSTSTGGASNLFVINADGSGKPERLTTSDHTQTPSSWTAPANAIVFLQRTQPDTNGIWVLPLNGARTPTLFLESRFSLSHPEVSPDGRWMAYVSNESGTHEVFVQPYPGPGEKVRISTAGGTEPVWNPNGRELLYRNDGKVFSVAITSTSPLRADSPKLALETKPGEYDSTSPIRSWSVSADGRRFLLPKFEYRDTPVTAFNIVLNWTEELTRVAAGSR
jgi:serine/threonine-protein kinase